MSGPKQVASHTMKYDVFDDKYFIILVLNFNTSGCLKSKKKMK